MRKWQHLLALSLALVLLLSGCGAGGSSEATDTTQPEATTEEEATVSLAAPLPDDPYQAVEYNLYPGPEGGYVGDVMPFVTSDGTLELYYLYDTSHNGQGYHPIYKYSTQKLYGYEDHGMVLNYGQGSDPDPALGTGSVMQDANGLYHLFYTGHNDTGNGGRGKECAMHATSTDGENWVKDPEPLFFAPEGYSKDDFRDPEVFWVEEEGCYWLLMAARNDELSGVVLKYTSNDLVNWELVGPMFAPMAQYMCECPDLFQIGDKWYLTYSWDCVTYYAVSDSIYGPFVPPRDNILDGKGLTEGAGFIFYAGKTAQIGDHIYLCAWIGQAGLSSDSGIYQWAGNVMNHEIYQLEDGKLGVKAPEVFNDYFTVDKPINAAAVIGDVQIDGNKVALSSEADAFALADLGTRPATMTLECDVTMEQDGCVGFAFGGSENDPTWTAMALDARKDALHFEGYQISDLRTMEPGAITKFDFDRSYTHHVKLVCENEIVVLYVDGLKAHGSRITHSTNGAHIGLFVDGGNATFSNITMKLPE